ncbi:hypothetical protein M9Y10_003823 [Tritrichomonas musculus]|uniref:Uncharacterized protein n=1 Tax=Tritrichomonas musculus TaxID=1915356 RepID=A0ABR2JQP6_9EUKA
MIPKVIKKTKHKLRQGKLELTSRKRGRPRKDKVQNKEEEDQNDFMIFVLPYLTRFREQEIAPGARVLPFSQEEIVPSPDWMLGQESNQHYTNRQRRMLENAWLQESKELQDLCDYEEEESLVEETNDINTEKYHYKEKVADFNKEGWDNLDEEA